MSRRYRSRSRDRGRGAPQSAALAPRSAVPASAAPAPAPKPGGGGDVPDWLADLFPGGGGGETSVNTPALPTGIAKPLEIPQALVIAVTANNEALQKKVSAATGASIVLRQDTRQFGYSLALFAGPSQATFKAREMLERELGLGQKGPVTRTVDLHSQNSTAIAALRQVVPMISAKHNNMPIKIIPPRMPGMPFQVAFGPGPLAHCVTAESTLRRQLRDIEISIYVGAGRRVPTGIKYAMMCKHTMDRRECPNISCQFCHTEAELEIASRCLWENTTNVQELKAHDGPIAINAVPWSPAIKEVDPGEKVSAPQAVENVQEAKSDSGSSGLL